MLYKPTYIRGHHGIFRACDWLYFGAITTQNWTSTKCLTNIALSAVPTITALWPGVVIFTEGLVMIIFRSVVSVASACRAARCLIIYICRAMERIVFGSTHLRVPIQLMPLVASDRLISIGIKTVFFRFAHNTEEDVSSFDLQI